jgi:hypothetical protein
MHQHQDLSQSTLIIINPAAINVQLDGYYVTLRAEQTVQTVHLQDRILAILIFQRHHLLTMVLKCLTLTPMRDPLVFQLLFSAQPVV